jgi:uncharacterized RDD family membrane protein YckC
MTAEEYVDQVVRCLPPPLRLRTPIGMEVRSHIAERVEHGQSIDEAARQLGDPTALAASYVAALPLTPALFWPRAAAKIIDVLVIVAAMLPLLLIVPLVQRFGPLLVLFIIVFASAVFFGYLVVAEYLVGQTLGKRLLGMCVVRESGTRIGLGQSIVRQLPWLFEIFWIDTLFALFTEKHQRAFELLSKTRVIALERTPGFTD